MIYRLSNLSHSVYPMFPLLYHTHHSLHPEDLPFWLELAASHSAPLLELGCGTGRVLIPLAQAGHLTYGLDNDFGMLTFLRKHLPEDLHTQVRIFQADFASFHLAQPFGLIIMPCNTYGTLDNTTRQATLDRVGRHLLPDGLFAASLPNPEILKRLSTHAEAEVEEVFLHPLSGEPVQVSSAWERSKQDLVIAWHYDHLLPDGGVQRLSAQVRQYLHPAQIYLDEMQKAGFNSFTLYGDFDRSPYHRTSPQLIILASLNKYFP
jgi:SAM-dependent methyltransferase